MAKNVHHDAGTKVATRIDQAGLRLIKPTKSSPVIPDSGQSEAFSASGSTNWQWWGRCLPCASEHRRPKDDCSSWAPSSGPYSMPHETNDAPAIHTWPADRTLILTLRRCPPNVSTETCAKVVPKRQGMTTRKSSPMPFQPR